MKVLQMRPPESNGILPRPRRSVTRYQRAGCRCPAIPQKPRTNMSAQHQARHKTGQTTFQASLRPSTPMQLPHKPMVGMSFTRCAAAVDEVAAADTTITEVEVGAEVG